MHVFEVCRDKCSVAVHFLTEFKEIGFCICVHLILLCYKGCWILEYPSVDRSVASESYSFSNFLALFFFPLDYPYIFHSEFDGPACAENTT